MSPLEGRAWLQLLGLCPAYAAYFAVQIGFPGWITTMPQRISCLAAAAGVHAAVFVIGLLVLKRHERGERPLADERDHAIETRATRTAYFVLLTGAVVVGMVMPFSQGGWKIVNTTVLVIVVAEALRNVLIVLGYRGTPRLAR